MRASPRCLKLSVAFSLLELICTVGILVIVVLLVFPAASRVSENGMRARCVSNLRTLATATMSYVSEHNGLFPHLYYTLTEDGGGTRRTPDAVVGQWYWHLAPYLGYARWENGGMNLGERGSSGLAGPTVFLCPAASPEREDINPSFLQYPSLRPVTYAPSSRTHGEPGAPPRGLATTDREIGAVYAPRLGQIINPSRKIWLVDSPSAGVLNVTASRWSKDYGPTAWPYQGFTRHQGGGNALFFDGHVEWVPISAFTGSTTGSLAEKTRVYFDPLY